MAQACTAALAERMAAACVSTTALPRGEQTDDKLHCGSFFIGSVRKAGAIALHSSSHSSLFGAARRAVSGARIEKVSRSEKVSVPHTAQNLSSSAMGPAPNKGVIAMANTATVSPSPSSSSSEETDDDERVFNFAAGPATLPLNVLKIAQADLVNWRGSGMSVLEMSHRGKDFMAIIQKAEADLRTLMGIPDDYYVMFLQGGATQQFSAVPLNLCSPDDVVDHVITGSWSSKAYEESKKYCKANVAVNAKPTKFTVIPPPGEWQLTPGARYVHVCANETIHGVEFKEFPDVGDAILVADMSSNFCSKPVDVSRFGVIYAGAQKNVGPSGVTIVIVRKDLVGHAQPHTPIMLDWKTQADNDSLYNTPPCYAIYMCGLVFDDLLAQGGLEAVERKNKEKASLIYDAIDKSGGFYICPVEKSVRSLMNVPFTLAVPELEAQLLKEATAQGLVQLKGHRSVGGVRASIYNAMPKAGVQKLVDLMKSFQAKHSS